MNTVEQIHARLAALSPLECELTDESAAHAGHIGAVSGGHYRLKIVSNAFAGLSPVARHRLVYKTLGAMMQQSVHALSIIALTPEEIARSRSSGSEGSVY